MGNCICFPFHSSQKTFKVVVFNGGAYELDASTTVEEITSGPYLGYKLVHQANPFVPISTGTKLQPGEVYHLLPSVPVKVSNQVQQGCKIQKVRIVVSREQLELLLSGAKKFRSKDMGSFVLQEPQKWRPSLAVIPEVRKF